MKEIIGIAVSLFIVVGIVIFAVIGVDSSTPLFTRVKFDNICNKYLSEMSIDGGLSGQKKGNLEKELEDIGFTNINIDAEENLEWGSEGTLKVVADYKNKSLNKNLERKENLKTFKYETSTGIFGLEN